MACGRQLRPDPLTFPSTPWLCCFLSPDTGKGIITSGKWGSPGAFEKIGPLYYSSSLSSKNNQGPRKEREVAEAPPVRVVLAKASPSWRSRAFKARAQMDLETRGHIWRPTLRLVVVGRADMCSQHSLWLL